MSDASSSQQSGSMMTGTSSWSDDYSTSFLTVSYGLFQRLSYLINSQRLLGSWFLVLVLAVQLIQWFTVPFEVAVIAIDSTALSSDAVARWFSVIRAPGLPSLPNQIVMWVTLCVTLLISIIYLLEWATLRAGSVPHDKITKLLRVVFWAVSVLSFPLYSVCWSEYGRLVAGDLKAEAGTIVYLVGSACCAVVLLCLEVVISFFIIDVSPRSSPLSGFVSRINVAMALAKCLVACSHHLLNPNWPSAHASVMLVCFVMCSFLVWKELPYHRKVTNWIIGGFWTSQFAASVIAFIAAFTGTIGPIIAMVVVYLVTMVVSVVVLRLRTHYYERMLTRDDRLVDEINLKDPSVVLFIVRKTFFITDGGRGNALVERAIQLVVAQKDRHHMVAMVHVAHALILLETLNDTRGAMIQLRTAKRLPTAFDMKYAMNCLLQMSVKRTQEDQHKEDIDTRITLALRHQRMAIASAARFWQLLIRTHSDSDSNVTLLMKIVRSTGDHEEKANNIFQDLMRHNPRHVGLLRAYGRFVNEVRNDRETADNIFSFADECEEEETKRLTRAARRAKKSSKGVKFGQTGGVAAGDSTTKVTVADTDITAAGDGNTPNVMETPQLLKLENAKISGRVADQSDDEEEAAGIGEVSLQDVEKGRNSKQVIKPSSSSTPGEMSMALSDSRSIGDQSSISCGTEKAVRARVLRKKIETAKSAMIFRLHIAVAVTLGTLLLCSVINYSVSTTTLSKFGNVLSQMSNSVFGRHFISLVALYARDHELALVLNNTNATESALSGLEYTNKFESVISKLFSVSSSYDSTKQLWAQANNLVSVYIPHNKSVFKTGHFVNQSVPLWDFATTFIKSARAVFGTDSLVNTDDGDDLGTILPNLRSTGPFRYTMDNGPLTLVWKLRDLNTALAEIAHGQAMDIVYFLSGFFPGSLLVVVIVVVVIYLPVLHHVKREREAAVKLFQDIPKSSIINIYERLTKDEGETTSSNPTEVERMSSITKLNLAYGFSLLFLASFCAAIFGVAVSFAVDEKDVGYVLAGTGVRQSGHSQLILWSQELTVHDKTTNSRRKALSNYDYFQSRWLLYDKALKYGDASLKVRSIISDDPQLSELWYDRPCPSWVTGGTAECKGFNTLESYYFNAINDFAYGWAYANGTVREDDTVYNKNLFDFTRKLHAITIPWYDDDLTYTYEYTENKKETTASAVTALFWVSVPIAVVLYLFVRWLVSITGSETERLFRLLLYVPPNVLDSVHSIRYYLDGQSAMEVGIETDKEQERITKSIVEGCEDMVLLCNSNRLIQVFNSQAEHLTGYTADEAINSDISMVIPPDIGSNCHLLDEVFTPTGKSKKFSAEVTVRTKSGASFQSLVSVSKTVVHGVVTTALFIRDITAIKDHETEIVKQRNKAEGLLLNILPKQIADELNALSANQEGLDLKNRSVSIAKSYSEATILFADIVGFTTMSSSMKAEDVVAMLNSIFSAFDAECDRLKVEKIKTIGDAYMAVTGVPSETPDHAELMMEFAIIMLAKIREYNTLLDPDETPVNIRIGINTGKVVAGVIGMKKIVFDLWGDSVNVASRMEHSGVPGHIQVTEATYLKLKDKYPFDCRGLIPIQGKGDMLTYLYTPSLDPVPPPSAALSASKVSQLSLSDASGGTAGAGTASGGSVSNRSNRSHVFPHSPTSGSVALLQIINTN